MKVLDITTLVLGIICIGFAVYDRNVTAICGWAVAVMAHARLIWLA